MDYEDVFNNSPKGDEVRKILEICTRSNYPPRIWSSPRTDASRKNATRFLSAWEKLTGKSQGTADEGLPFSWNLEELRSRSAELLAIHKAVIFKGLSPYEGTGGKIDLFKWFWKDVIEEYIGSITVLEIPDKLSGIDLTYVPPDGSWVPAELRKEEEMREAAEAEMLGTCDEETKKTWEGLIGPGSGKAFREAVRRFRSKRNFYDDVAERSGDTLGFTTSFSLRNHCREGESLGETAISRIQNNEAIRLRLLLWWGWPGAPFLSMQRMIAKHIEHLVEEGYLHQTNAPSHPRRRQDVRDNEYKLTDAGKRGLEDLDPDRKAGLVDRFKEVNLVDLGNLISSVCAQLFSR
jgi:hypothetical protein